MVSQERDALNKALEALFNLGGSERQGGNKARAEYVFQTACRLADRFESISGLQRALLWRGNLLYHSRRYEEAENLLRYSLKLAKRTKDRSAVFSLLSYYLAVVYRDMGQNKRYLESLKKAKFLRGGAIDRVNRGFMYCHLAEAYLLLGRSLDALKAARTAMQRYGRETHDVHLSMACWQMFGECFLALGRLDHALDAYSKVQVLAETVAHPGPWPVRAATASSECFALVGHSGAARQAAHQAQHWSKNSKADTRPTEMALLGKAIAALFSGNYEECQTAVDQALLTAKTGCPDLSQVLYQTRGWTTYLQGNEVAAKTAAEAAIFEAGQAQPGRPVWPALHLLYAVSRRRGNARSAAKYRRAALDDLKRTAPNLPPTMRRLYWERPDRAAVRAGREEPVGYLRW